MSNETTVASQTLSGPGASRPGNDMRLTLQCPKCDTTAWVEWCQLPHLLHCRGCHNSFWIDKTGHIQSEHEVGKARAACPRCKAVREWPRGVVPKDIRCLKCGCEIPHDPELAAESLNQRITGAVHEAPRPKKDDYRPASRTTVILVVAAGLLVFCLAVFALARGTSTDDALVHAAQGFNAAVLAGNSKQATQWIFDGQKRAYDTWTILNASNRPIAGLRGPVKVEVVDYATTTAKVNISYQRTIQDACTIVQVWRRPDNGSWRFDPSATLQQAQ